MAILEKDLKAPAKPGLIAQKHHKFSRQDYYAMGEAGILVDQRVELIEGEIIEMAPIGDPHSSLTDPLRDVIKDAFGPGFTVRTQVPISLGDDQYPSEPQPDVTVAIGTWRDYSARKPKAGDIRLLVEIAETSITYDRKLKSVLYATAGIPEYWIVNLANRTLEVYREPVGKAYTKKAVLKSTDIVTPVHAPTSAIAVSDCLP